MQVLKCKMCGGSVTVEPGQSIGECEYCGSVQTLTKTQDETIINLYNRANNLRLKCEFDKAGAVYEKIVEADDAEAEAHWGIVLCKYGIEYVEDPKSHARIPTCHRTLYDAITKDADYLAAIDYSDPAQQEIYEKEARAIDRIQRDILAIVKNEKPFDVFLCYKETGADGKRTIDSTLANDIYYQLTQEGFKVFYAAITLEDKLGQEYEPYIFAAMNSAKVMLAIGTKPEHFNAVWVKNEWSRFLSLMKTDRSKTLIPCYRDMDAYDLPEEFAHLQAQDMSKIGFIPDLVRGIKKLIVKEEPKEEEKVAPSATTSAAPGIGNVEPILERMFLFLEDGMWQDAVIYSEKALDIAPKNGEAYLGKLMADLQIKTRNQLGDCEEPFTDNENYKKVIRFGDTNLGSEIHEYLKRINERIKDNDRKHHIKIERAANVITQHFQKKYYLSHKTQLENEITSLKNAAENFHTNKEKLCSAKDELSEYEKQRDTWVKQKESIGFFNFKEKRETEANIIAYSQKIQNKQNEIAELTPQVAEFSSSSEIHAKLSIKQAELDKVTQYALSSKDSEISYEDAIMMYTSDASIRDEIDKKNPNIRVWLKQPGVCFYFGHYPQTSNEYIKTPIEWVVLENDGKKALVISKYAISCLSFDDFPRESSWNKCSLRSWLNETFILDAFSPYERAQIVSSTIIPGSNPQHPSVPDVSTPNNLFLLSVTEAQKYYPSYELRKCIPTEYAKSRGTWVSKNNLSENGEAPCWWWLRTPGADGRYITGVNYNGSINYDGFPKNAKTGGVRPAMWIDIDD